MSPGSLHGLNGLRAIASLLIVLFHITEHLRANGREIWFPFHQTPGIHLFLVISGFMLVYASRDNDTPERFIVRRMARIVPLYWLLTLVTVALALWHNWLFPGIDLSPDGVISSFLFLPDENGAGYIRPNLFTGWTLNYIVPAYLLFALATLAPVRHRPYVATGLILVFMVLAALIPDDAMRKFWSDPIQLELIGGMAAAIMLRDPRVVAWVKGRPTWPLLLVATVALLAAVMSNLTGLQRTLACGFPASMIVLVLAARDAHRKPFKDGFIPWLGRISYSVYLIHPLVIPLVGLAVIGSLGAPWVETGVVITATLTITVAAAGIAYVLVERPVSVWFSRRAGGRLRTESFEI